MSGVPVPPVTDDIDTAPFFAAAGEGRLVARRCADCGKYLHVPRAYCRYCGSWNTGFQEVSPHGRLYSWTVVRQQLHPALPVPYTIVLVDVDDAQGVRLAGRIDGETELQPGMAMQARFEAITDSAALPQWEPIRRVYDNEAHLPPLYRR
jgi:uncharacterized OB-fold protein